MDCVFFKVKVMYFLPHSKTHNTPVHWAATQDTHTHAEDVTGGNCPLLFTHPELPFLTASQKQWAAFLWRPGTKPSARVQSLVRDGQESDLFFCSSVLLFFVRTCVHRVVHLCLLVCAHMCHTCH